MLGAGANDRFGSRAKAGRIGGHGVMEGTSARTSALIYPKSLKHNCVAALMAQKRTQIAKSQENVSNPKTAIALIKTDFTSLSV